MLVNGKGVGLMAKGVITDNEHCCGHWTLILLSICPLCVCELSTVWPFKEVLCHLSGKAESSHLLSGWALFGFTILMKLILDNTIL